MTNKYELTVVLDPKATPAKKKLVSDQIAKLTKLFDGKVEKEEDWGEKETGQLLHFLLELDSVSVKNLSTKLNGEEGIKKYLIVRK